MVGPLLTLILADGESLVTHVMPTALLEQSRNVLRERFSAIILKKVYTLTFDRGVEDSDELVAKLFAKLDSARKHRDVVCAAPESVKSLLLKFIEQLHAIEEIDPKNFVLGAKNSSRSSGGASKREQREVTRLRTQMLAKSDMADKIVRILDMWNSGILIMDEVDVLLHPLKSELNFPIGSKQAIDLAGSRWDLPIHLIDAIFYHSTRDLSEDIADYKLVEQLLGFTPEEVRSNSQ